MSFSALLAEVIARKLLEEYREGKGGTGNLDPASFPNTPGELAAGLVKMLSANVITDKQLEDIYRAMEAGQVVAALPMFQNAVKKFKDLVNSSPGGSIPVNGVLTSDVLSRFFSLKRCFGLLRSTPPTSAVPSPDGPTDIRRIRYFIKGPLPAISDAPEAEAARRLLHEAWINWGKVIDLDCWETKTEANANVLVYRHSLDAREGGTLADAHVGPPNGMVFHLRIDSGEDGTWTKRKFRGTMTHEIGHLLGLQHSSVGGQLMSPFYDDNVVEPTVADVDRLLALGYQRPSPKLAAPQPTEGTIDG